MAQKTFLCKLITPSAQVLSEQVTYASVPAWDGLMGFQNGRAPIVAKLGLGELRLDFPDTPQSKGGSRSFLVEDGFLQMIEDRLTILAGKAIPVESLTPTEAQQELAAALARKPTATASVQRQAEQERISKEQALARAKVRLATSGKGI